MSNFYRAAYDPKRGVVRTAYFIDDYFGKYIYGVRFDLEGPVYKTQDVEIPLDMVFIPEEKIQDE